MKRTFFWYSKPAQLLGIALLSMTALTVYGTLSMPIAQAAQGSAGMFAAPSAGGAAVPAAASTTAPAVAVDQQPLTLQPPIPPDIVVMLDDSGSMNWDYMPDACYLNGVTCSGTSNGTNPVNGQGVDYVQSANNDALIDSNNNGLYYNPKVAYLPPPQANGASYANYTDMTSVPVNGFNAAAGTIADLTNYSNPDVSGELEACGIPGNRNCGTSLNYSTTVTNGPSYNISSKQMVTASYENGNFGSYESYADQVCQSGDFNHPAGASNYAFTGLTRDNAGNWLSGTCAFTYPSTTYRYFQYSVGPAAGPYVVHYVAPAIPGCGSQANCVVSSDTSGAAAPNGVAVGQNIANWFAYYHTRILMAKSGLTSALNTLNPSFRVGFGSIDGASNGNSNNLPTLQYNYGSTYMAEVQPFGNTTLQDASGNPNQRANFWNWITQASASGGTPLRRALDAVGQYYSDPGQQAWSTMSGDPTYGTSTAGSPIACRQAYTILTTDGFWNSNYSSTTVAGASDTQGPTVKGENGQTYTYNAAAPYSGGDTTDGSPSLADVAMYYWKTDLQSNMKNEVPTSTDDPAFWQHMATFTLGLGFTPTGIAGTAANGDSPPSTQDIFDWANGGKPITNFAWPQPSANSIYNIADLEHAGVNGHGGFFSATNPQTFLSGLQSALKRATERVGTGASLAANSTQLTTGTVIYQADYYTSTWLGDLKAFSVNAVTGAIATNPTWQASKAMPAASTRNIVTWNGSQFVPFQNGASAPPNLSTAQLAALDSPMLGSDATAQETMVDYLRGNQTQEQQNGGVLRTRNWTLGDVVDSQPVYSGAPNPNEFVGQSFYGTTTDSSGTIPFYSWAVGTTNTSGTFVPSAASQRTPLLFVASNDGMLHAFNASTGVESFAYLPGAVITAGLANLANPAYGSAADPHQFYNDGQLTIADAYLPSLPQINGSSWHTILVGTTGRGKAEAIYALDVTDPNAITPLWERSAGDGQSGSQYIGQMVGKPVIAQTNNSQSSGSGASSSTWSVLIGNGYNSAAGVAALLQFNLATGALSVHTTDNKTANGLAAPALWMDNPGDGVSDVAYAGDLLGRVWSFQLNDTTGSNPTPTSTGTLLFTATDASNNPQPITAGMLAGKNPTTGDVWLFFGTGRYLSSADLSSTQTQTWYGIIVQSATKNIVGNLSQGRSALVQRTILSQTAGGGGTLPARTVSTQTVSSTNGTTDMTGKSGWYLDLLAPVGTGNAPVQQGERMVDPNEFQGALLIGVTRIPQVTDVCNPSGSGWIMALDPFTGTAPSGDFFDVNGDGYVNSGDEIGGKHAAGVGFGSLPNAPIFVGGVMETSFDNGTTSSLKTAGTVGTTQRMSWRELVNP